MKVEGMIHLVTDWPNVPKLAKSAAFIEGKMLMLSYCFHLVLLWSLLVCEVVQTLQLCTDRDQSDVVGDLSVCLDGMSVDPETFATAEANHHSESLRICSPNPIFYCILQFYI